MPGSKTEDMKETRFTPFVSTLRSHLFPARQGLPSGLPRIVTAIAILFLAAAVPSGAKAAGADAGADARPNLIMIIADDMAWNDSTPYGHPHIQTPNLERLAAEGMRFDQAFLTCSSCSPSRCSIITGRYPHATGAAELHMPLPDQPTYPSLLKAAGYYTAQAGKWHLGNEVRDHFDRVEEMDKATNPSGCGQWVEVLQERPKDKPFFLWLASSDPHRSYEEGAIPTPHTAEDIVVPPFFPDTPEVRADLGLYYDEISRLDSFVGKVLDELDAQGVAENTFIVFLSDNGRPFPRCKTTIYDSGVKTPFIVRWPAGLKAGQSTGSLVSSIDIAPTFLELAGVTPPEGRLQGVSFLPILKDPQAETRDYIYAEHNWHDYQAHKRSVRSKDYLYIYDSLPFLNLSPPADAVRSPTYVTMMKLRDQGKLNINQMQCFLVPRPPKELYDVKADPYQFHNLAAEEEFSYMLNQMREIQSEWANKYQDPKPDLQTLTPDGFDRITGERFRQPKNKAKTSSQDKGKAKTE